ncbi:hypothetical protein C2G38_2157588 [Gigaspora rosea]|uniref:SAP domain-containing protein n=1 Tax=Gigaspora rosea TaxID=44941 RepID=A0A397W312_9GLOM|nr:hypothetical protein C2G38_2157588 [Gigaspora rosea]
MRFCVGDYMVKLSKDEDENEVQEVLPAMLALESGEGYDVEESSHQGLKSTLEQLLVETLKLLYNGEGLSEVGVKRDLVERLVKRVVSKSKRKERIDDDDQGNNVWGENNGNSDLQFLALERSLEKSIQATLEKAVGEIKRSVQVMQNSEERRILDNTLVNRDWEMIGKVHDVAATQAFTLRVAKKEGWNVAAGIRDLLDDDPIEDGKSEMLGVFFPNGPREMGAIASNPMAHWSMPGIRIPGGLSKGSMGRRKLEVGQLSVFRLREENGTAMAGLALHVQEYLRAVVRVHKKKGFKSPVEDFGVREVLREI